MTKSLLISTQAELVCFFCLSFPDENIRLQILAVQVFTLMRMKPPELRLSEWSDVSETKVLLSHLPPPLYSPRSHRGSQGCVFPPCGRGFDLQPAQERHGGDLLAVLLPLRPRLGARV